jgi:hypothetical protein
MAIPQCAIAHDGSAATIFSNCGRASSYQKSWSSATPRLKLARTGGEQDTGNDTAPKCSPTADAGESPAACVPAPAGSGSRAMQTQKDIQTEVRIFMARILSIRRTRGACSTHPGAKRVFFP